MKVIVILGAPGSGKGTAAKQIEEYTSFVQLSTGDLLREEIAAASDIGNKAKDRMERGELVSDEIIIDMVKRKIRSASDTDYLFDGFPRTVEQAKQLNDLLKEFNAAVDCVLLLAVGEKAVVERITGRRICSKCAAVYHVVYNKPQKPGICDKCGGDLYQREDDNLKTIENRYRVYKSQTEGVVEYYNATSNVTVIDAEQSSDAVFSDIMKSIS
ncbi:MAG: adenylate kinase [Spartobacteria bacterium]|nr:adenylate kinase [Spartobacteria bacterium]